MSNIEKEYEIIKGRSDDIEKYGEFLERAEATIVSDKTILILPDEALGKILVKSDFTNFVANDDPDKFDEK